MASNNGWLVGAAALVLLSGAVGHFVGSHDHPQHPPGHEQTLGAAVQVERKLYDEPAEEGRVLPNREAARVADCLAPILVTLGIPVRNAANLQVSRAVDDQGRTRGTVLTFENEEEWRDGSRSIVTNSTMRVMGDPSGRTVGYVLYSAQSENGDAVSYQNRAAVGPSSMTVLDQAIIREIDQCVGTLYRAP